jgi:hypothetical protein
VGLGFLIVEVLRYHSDTPHSVGLLWTSDRPVAGTKHDTHKRQTSMSPAGFEPAITAGERLQTHALDCVGTGIDEINHLVQLNSKNSLKPSIIIYVNLSELPCFAVNCK